MQLQYVNSIVGGHIMIEGTVFYETEKSQCSFGKLFVWILSKERRDRSNFCSTNLDSAPSEGSSGSILCS